MMTDFVLSSAEGSQEGSAGRTVFEGSDEFAPVSLPPRLQAPSSVFDGDLWTTEAGLFCVREGVASRVPQVVTSAVAPTDLEPGDVWVDTSTPTWVAPTLLNSWANYGPEWATAGYYRDASGLVYLRGLVKSGTNNAAIFMLPSGYRPTAGRIFSVHAGGGQARLDVLYDGTVKTNGYYSSGTNAYVSLSGVFFETF